MGMVTKIKTFGGTLFFIPKRLEKGSLSCFKIQDGCITFRPNSNKVMFFSGGLTYKDKDKQWFL